jgi:hypothetical protein
MLDCSRIFTSLSTAFLHKLVDPIDWAPSLLHARFTALYTNFIFRSACTYASNSDFCRMYFYLGIFVLIVRCNSI